MMTKAYYTKLPNRSAIRVIGPDAADFLQGLVTQDMAVLQTQPLAYSALLTAQGKVDIDFFVRPIPDGVLLDVDTPRAQKLADTLAMHRLRKNVTIEIAPLQVFAVWGDDGALGDFDHPRDPRSHRLGLRAYDDAKPNAEEESFDIYDRLRISVAAPDGGRDFMSGEDTVADLGLEHLNGVSFTKGCYKGQELTSRMHHRGLGKKGLYPVRLATDAPPPPFSDLIVDGNLIGEMRSQCGDVGLAMLRHDSLKLAEKTGLLADTQH